MKNTGNLYQQTSLRNGGRRAGIGILYDDYSDESFGGGNYDERYLGIQVRFPNDNVKPEELNGPVICYKSSIRAVT